MLHVSLFQVIGKEYPLAGIFAFRLVVEALVFGVFELFHERIELFGGQNYKRRLAVRAGDKLGVKCRGHKSAQIIVLHIAFMNCPCFRGKVPVNQPVEMVRSRFPFAGVTGRAIL